MLRPALLRASRALRREAQRAGASALDAQLLGVIKKNGGIGVSELADREQMTRASMSGHVKRLERAGWIERAVGEDADKRRVGLSLTAQGGKALDAIRRRRNDWLAARLSRLSADRAGRAGGGGGSFGAAGGRPLMADDVALRASELAERRAVEAEIAADMEGDDARSPAPSPTTSRSQAWCPPSSARPT